MWSTFALQKWPLAEVGLALDYDFDKLTGQDKTHKTEIKDPRLKVIRCDFKGCDFNDTQGNLKTIRRLQTMETEKGILSCEVPKPEPIKRIGLLKLQTGSITIIGAGPGEGKSSTLIKIGAHNSTKGDGRPMMIYTREQSIKRLVLPMWSRFGGRKHWLYYPTFPGYNPEQIPWGIARPQVFKACASGEFSYVLLDLVYLTVKDENSNKEYEQVLLEIQNCLSSDTSFIATAHLKKDVKDQPLLHHYRGGSDLVGIPDRILYLRRGKQKSERVIVNLKDRYTGDLSGGWITSMPDKKKGDMEIRASGRQSKVNSGHPRRGPCE